jgi:Ca2+-binding RTX toxin-like protein
MAIMRFTSTPTEPGLDMLAYQADLVELLFAYENVAGTSAALKFFNDSANQTVFSGTGFKYDLVNGYLAGANAGTVNSIMAVYNGQTALSITGLFMSANAFSDFVNAGLSASAFALIIGGNDEIVGGTQGDTLIGGIGQDTITGGTGGDSLIGGVGNDNLFGGSGGDNLRGGSDADVLFGGLGADELRGGGGRDVFVFNTALGSTQRDTITDFTAVDDVIKLDNAIFAAFTTLGTMLATRFHIGVAAADAGDRIIYDRAEGVLSYDRDGTGSAAAVIFALVDPGTALGYQDFVII